MGGLRGVDRVKKESYEHAPQDSQINHSVVSRPSEFVGKTFAQSLSRPSVVASGSIKQIWSRWVFICVPFPAVIESFLELPCPYDRLIGPRLVAVCFRAEFNRIVSTLTDISRDNDMANPWR
jgi:hypothetical protein